ncbi:MAG: RNA polymerase sigma factor [Anaerolineae bacterium]|nr:RNA polymerase sigma factor [Anaerolineae bacterium]
MGYLYRMTGSDRGLAEDLAQETFLRVLRAIHQYRYPRPFKPWLYMIATNLARDYYKRAETRFVEAMPDDDGLSGQQADPPETVLIDTDEAQQVATAVMHLPEHQRETLVLRYYQELSLAEIAEILDIPVGTVKSRLSLGIRNLKAYLERQYS